MLRSLFTGIIYTGIFCALPGSPAAQTVYTASDPAVSYIGRVKKHTDGSVSFDWSGVYARVRFSGSRIALKASDTKYNDFNVFIDGKPAGKIGLKSRDTSVTLAEGLGYGTHQLLLQKSTEGMEGRTTFHAFTVDKDAKLYSCYDEPTRLIEFVGNSITCGYGTESDEMHRPYDPRTENSYKSYGPILARFFGADYVLTSHSGRGIVKNWDDTVAVSAYTMRDRFLKLYDEGEEEWDFKAYCPDLVVINLGTNDYSREPHPTEKQFTDAYRTLIGHIRSRYGKVPVLCIAPLGIEQARLYLPRMIAASGDPDLHYAALDNAYIDEGPDLGPDWHPNYNGQRKIALNLIPYISKIMKWSIPFKAIE